MDNSMELGAAAGTPLFALLRNSHEGILILNSEGEVLFANPSATDIFGRSETELIGSSMGLPISPSLPGAEKTVLEVLHKHGEPRTVEMATTETVWQDERVQLAILHDITDRVRAEEKYRIIAENTGDLITVLDSDTLNYVSPSVRTLFGYSPAEFADLGLLGTCHPDDGALIYEALSHGKQTPEELSPDQSSPEKRSNAFDTFENEQESSAQASGHIRFVSRHRRRDGVYCWFETVGRIQTLETGRAVTVLNTRDIHDRVETKQALERSVEEKQFLLRELNHRVKNNLALVGSLIYTKEASLGGEVDLSDLRNRIDVIRVVYDKLHRTEEASNINLRDYMRELLDTVFGSLSERTIDVHLEMEDVTVPTKTAVPLGLIVNELATNAVKHGFSRHDNPVFSARLERRPPDNGEGAEDISTKCVLILSNTGPPIPEHVNIEAPQTLGLQLTALLTQQIDGELTLQRSPQPVFTIEFPIDES